MPAPQERRYPIFVTLSLWVECSLKSSHSILVLRSQYRISSFLGSVSFACVNLLFNAKDFTCYEIKYIIQKKYSWNFDFLAKSDRKNREKNTMKWMIASDIHGSAFYCEKMLKAFEREQADKLLLLGDILYHGPRNDLPKGYAPKKSNRAA